MSDPGESRITGIRRAIAGLMRGVDGVEDFSEYPVEHVSGAGVGWLGWDVENVTPGPNEIGRHELELFYVVNRNGRLPNELAETEPVIARMKTVVRGNQGLFGLTDHFYFRQIRQATIEVGSVDYTGFVMVLDFKTREQVASQIAY